MTGEEGAHATSEFGVVAYCDDDERGIAGCTARGQGDEVSGCESRGRMVAREHAGVDGEVVGAVDDAKVGGCDVAFPELEHVRGYDR